MRTLTPGARLEWQEGLAGPPMGVKGASPKPQHQETREKPVFSWVKDSTRTHQKGQGCGRTKWQNAGLVCYLKPF